MISNAFLLNQKHSEFIQTGRGKLARSMWRWEWFLVGLFLLLLGLVRVNYTLDVINDWRTLDQQGIVATFPVQGVSENRGFFGTEYTVRFSGEIGETTFSANRTTNSYTATFENGVEVVDVLYLPDDTLKMAIADGFGFPFEEVALTLIIFIGGLVMFAYSLRQLYYLVLLNRNGELIVAQITQIEKRRAGRQLNMTVHYVFDSPETGEIIAGKTNHNRSKLQNRKLPAKGMDLAVLYLNDNHYQAL